MASTPPVSSYSCRTRFSSPLTPSGLLSWVFDCYNSETPRTSSHHYWTLPQAAHHVDRLSRASSIQIRPSTTTLVSHWYFPGQLIKLYHMDLLGTNSSGLGVRHCRG
jgi:hypothetical protein